MEKFTKITVGFVTQSYVKNDAGSFICTEQEFIAGDQVDYENVDGNTITPPKHKCQSFEMSLFDGSKITGSIEDVLSNIDIRGEQSREFATEINMLKEILRAMGDSANLPKQTKLGFLEAQLLEACKVVTSYSTDLLYRLDDQVNISDVEEIQQARDVIDRYENMATQSGKLLIECFVSEQCSDVPHKKIVVNIMADSGKLWIQPIGYGEKCAMDGEGFPIGIEIWQDRLRLIAFDNINSETPQIIDLENARESNRLDTTD